MLRMMVVLKMSIFQRKLFPYFILPQNLWFNQYIQINKEPVHLVKFSDKNIDTVPHL